MPAKMWQHHCLFTSPSNGISQIQYLTSPWKEFGHLGFIRETADLFTFKSWSGSCLITFYNIHWHLLHLCISCCSVVMDILKTQHFSAWAEMKELERLGRLGNWLKFGKSLLYFLFYMDRIPLPAVLQIKQSSGGNILSLSLCWTGAVCTVLICIIIWETKAVVLFIFCFIFNQYIERKKKKRLSNFSWEMPLISLHSTG